MTKDRLSDSGWAALVQIAHEILVSQGSVNVPYEHLGAGFSTNGQAGRLSQDLQAVYDRDEPNARMIFRKTK